MLDRTRLLAALTLLGEDLASRRLFLELAVYGGSALVLQFEWRRGTQNVDALVRGDTDERLLAPSVKRVAEQLGLPEDWLNNAVGMFTPLREDAAWFEYAGDYPASAPDLRVLVARPLYLLGMKLKALSNVGRGEWDLDDARSLARELGVGDVGALLDLYPSVHDEEPCFEVRRRLASVLERS